MGVHITLWNEAPTQAAMRRTIDRENPPVHVVKVEKAKKVAMVYTITGRVLKRLAGMAFVAGLVWGLITVLTINPVGTLMVTTALVVPGLIVLGLIPYVRAQETLKLAKENGTIDD